MAQLIKNLSYGLYVWIAENSIDTEYQVVGKNVHSPSTVTLFRKATNDEYDEFASVTGSPLYKSSDLDINMNAWSMKYSLELSKILKEIPIITNTGTDTSETILRKVFAPSYTEIGLGNCNGITENAQCQHFTSDANRARSNTGFWLRSRKDADEVYRIGSSGSVSSHVVTPDTSWYPLCPMIVVPDTLQVADSETSGAYAIILPTTINFTSKISVDLVNMPTSGLLQIDYDGSGVFYLCNNYNDAVPTWETVTIGTAHEFTNNSKTAASWAVGVRVVISKSGSERLFCSRPVVLYV